MRPSAMIAGLMLLLALFDGEARGAIKLSEALEREQSWFRSQEGAAFVQNVLARQSHAGSWEKNQNSGEALPSNFEKPASGTFDNGATTGELRLLNKAWKATEEPEIKAAILKGLNHILAAQYPTGGWPQKHPPGEGYHRHITFNDNAMVRILELLRDVGEHPEFRWIDSERRERVRKAFARGVDCIVRAQIEAGGELTAWCAQHDAETLEPRSARSYELVSLSGSESAGLLRFLMSLDAPAPPVIEAVHRGVKWFDQVKLTGIRQIKVEGDKKIITDPNAPPLWARFYEIGTNRPIFCGRDGVVKYSLSEIEAERRNGYSWLGEWGTPVLREYNKWVARFSESPAIDLKPSVP